MIAPDYPGFGFSDAPSEEAFKPTFANLATVMDGFVSAIRLGYFTIYMQDFGTHPTKAALRDDWPAADLTGLRLA